MAWLNIEKAPLPKQEKRELPNDLWFKCQKCQEVIYKKDFESNQMVCTQCGFHYPILASTRLTHLLDPKSFEPMDTELMSNDPLNFCDRKTYKSRLKDAHKKLHSQDAFISGSGLLMGYPVLVGAFDFRFMGGSMGSVVGEKIARLFLKGAQDQKPVVIFSTSGGARMQEGLLSLMQMAKTCSALSILKDAKVPMISVLTHPTTGGVAASYAMLGDVNIAEPEALIGFAGPRVIRQTIGQSLPEGFQSSEYLLEHGMMDLICHRGNLRETLHKIIFQLYWNKKLNIKPPDNLN